MAEGWTGRSLLGDLWGEKLEVWPSRLEVCEEAAKDGKGKAVVGEGGSKFGFSYAQVASLSSSEKRSSSVKRGTSLNMEKNAKMGAKRPRSPRDGACGRCFKTSHVTAECRHQVVCLRCSGVGHVAARCPMENRRSPRRRRVHVRSKLVGNLATSPRSRMDEGRQPEVGLKPLEVQGGVNVSEGLQHPRVSRESLSLSLTPESYELREELAKVVVLSVVRGQVNDGSVLEVIPSIINTKVVGPIVPLNESSFLVPFENRDEVCEMVKMGMFDVMTKDGRCSLNLAHWTAELGVLGRADGAGQWVTIWNLSLHG